MDVPVRVCLWMSVNVFLSTGGAQAMQIVAVDECMRARRVDDEPVSLRNLLSCGARCPVGTDKTYMREKMQIEE